MSPISRIAISGSLLLVSGLVAGCGTTHWTDTRRTATEQLLISDAVDRAVQEIDFRQLGGKDVYLDDSFLTGIVDQDYLVSTLRQHLLASGCILKTNRDDATYVVEARAGAVGTDRHDLLFGVPATTIPTFVSIPGMPTTIPEIPLVKRTDQMGVAKLAVFAYHRDSGLRVWQSGLASKTSKAKDFWVLGAGPFQKGTIYDGLSFAGEKVTISNPLVHRTPDVEDRPRIGVTQERAFPDPTTAIALRPLPTSAASLSPVEAPAATAAGPALATPATPGPPPAGATTPSKPAPVSPPPIPNPPNPHRPVDARSARLPLPSPPAATQVPLPTVGPGGQPGQ